MSKKLENYGFSRSNYRALIENDGIKASEIAKRLNTPQNVYRFRRFGYEEENTGTWIESSHWEDDVDGIIMFSYPDSFNKNDSNDCKVRFDKDIVLKYMSNPNNIEEWRKIKENKEIIDSLNEYEDSLQKCMKIACFTLAGPTDIDMWDDIYFGDRGKGICIEYEVNDESFRPDGIPFLPVLYDDDPYDNTEAMKCVIDYVKDELDEKNALRMVCLGYGHTLIKPTKYEKEQEWRIVIPKRQDGKYTDFFNIDQDLKRDMTPVVKKIYLGPRFEELEKHDVYLDRILRKWKNIPIFKVMDVHQLVIEPVRNINCENESC